MAKAVPVSPNTVYRVLRENGLKPHLVRKFKLSSDPRFVEKLSDVIGLYMNPPERAMVLPTSLQDPLTRSQPSGRPRTSRPPHPLKVPQGTKSRSSAAASPS